MATLSLRGRASSSEYRPNLDPTLWRRIAGDIKAKQLTGQDGSGQLKPFVPYARLEEYWTAENIMDVLQKLKLQGHTQPGMIRRNFLRVFTTLVLIDRVDYLSAFTEHNLNDDFWPAGDFYKTWPTTYRDDFFNAFQETIWTFFPFQFERDGPYRELPLRCIIPIAEETSVSPTVRNSIVGPDTVRLRRIIVHGACNKLEKSTNIFLLKTYSNDRGEGRRAFQREQVAYNSLHLTGPQSDNFAKFYGSFEQNGRYNLVLEYIDGVNLLEYLCREKHPQTRGDIYDFWNSIFGVVEAIRRIHQMRQTPAPLPVRSSYIKTSSLTIWWLSARQDSRTGSRSS
jgi:hypothetical protein